VHDEKDVSRNFIVSVPWTPSPHTLSPDIESRIGFGTTKDGMRKIVLEDSISRLPEILAEVRGELTTLGKEVKILIEKKKFTDPIELKHVVAGLLYEIEDRIKSYLVLGL
jgi:hypothetical protein